MKTSGWVAAGASKQQEQHELEEESGFVNTGVKGGREEKKERETEGNGEEDRRRNPVSESPRDV